MNSLDEKYDFAVIGGGSAGYAAARTAHELGLKTVVIDGAEELGGLCILRGCMPSKTLIETANRALEIKEAEEFAIQVDAFSASAERLIERKRKIIAEFAEYRQEQLEDGRFKLIRGFASFEDSHTLVVSPKDGSEPFKISVNSTLIATGSKIFVPKINGLSEAGFLTSDDILELAHLPDSIAVYGGGAIALEMAHYLDAMGKKVSVIQRSDQLLSGSDIDVADTLKDALEARGIEIFCDTNLEKVEVNNGKKVTFFKHKGEATEVVADEILVALGRTPAVEKLNLDKAGVHLDGKRIATKPTIQTAQDHIFAAGDVSSPLEVVHIAIQQGEMAARNAKRVLDADNDKLEEIDYRLKLFGIFTEPQVANVGISEIEAKEKGIPIVTADYPFNDHGKSMIHGTEYGFVKLIAHAESKEILGGAVIGPHAAELIHEIVVAMAFNSTAEQLANIPHYHPTLSEIWTYPAEDIADM